MEGGGPRGLMVTWREGDQGVRWLHGGRGTKGSDGYMEGGGPRGLMVTWREGNQGV